MLRLAGQADAWLVDDLAALATGIVIQAGLPVARIPLHNWEHF